MSRRIDWDKAKRQQKAAGGYSAIDSFIAPSEWRKIRANGLWPKIEEKEIYSNKSFQRPKNQRVKKKTKRQKLRDKDRRWVEQQRAVRIAEWKRFLAERTPFPTGLGLKPQTPLSPADTGGCNAAGGNEPLKTSRMFCDEKAEGSNPSPCHGADTNQARYMGISGKSQSIEPLARVTPSEVNRTGVGCNASQNSCSEPVEASQQADPVGRAQQHVRQVNGNLGLGTPTGYCAIRDADRGKPRS